MQKVLISTGALVLALAKRCQPAAVLLLAGIVFGTMAARGTLAADRAPNVPAGAGLHSNHIGGFDRPLDRGPALPPPAFNQSNPYTMPQSPERPVSPASPGSVFGDH